MRILLWYWGRRGGGAAYALRLARGLAARGDVSLALSLAARNELLDEFRTLRVPLDAVETFAGAADALLATLRVPALRRRLVARARDLGPDTIVVSAMNHVWTPLVAPALPRARLRFVATVHDALPHPGDPAFAWEWRLRRELAAGAGAVVFSDSVRAAVAARRPGLPILRVPLPSLAGPATGTAAAPATDFLFFGRFRAYKGLDLLRDAWPILRAAHPAATLRVVGEGDPETCAPGLSALPGVTVEPRWVAEPEMPALVAAARTLVLPYREASQSGVIPVALGLGVPPVVTPVGGLTEQVRDEETGVVAEAPTPGALAAAMARTLDPALHARLAAGARAAGRSLTDPAIIAADLVAWLRTLPEGEAGPR